MARVPAERAHSDLPPNPPQLVEIVLRGSWSTQRFEATRRRAALGELPDGSSHPAASRPGRRSQRRRTTTWAVLAGVLAAACGIGGAVGSAQALPASPAQPPATAPAPGAGAPEATDAATDGTGSPAAPGEEPGPADEPGPPIPDVTPQVLVSLAELDVGKARDLLEVTRRLAGLTDQVVAHREAERAAIDDERRRIVAQVGELAVQAYVHGRPDVADLATTTDRQAAGQVLVGEVHRWLLQELAAATDRLAAADAQLDAARDTSQRAVADVDAAQRALEEAEAVLDHRRRAAAVAPATPPMAGLPLAAGPLAGVLAQVTAANGLPSIMGPSTLTEDELVSWVVANAPSSWSVSATPEALARTYFAQGELEGVRPDLAVAQAVVETGHFSSRLAGLNNFAGIGACDSCEDGWHIGGVEAGVRTHLQLLHAYARPATLGQAQPLERPEFASLWIRGCCPTWQHLTGRWATDPNYHPKIASVYLSMLEHAHRIRGA